MPDAPVTVWRRLEPIHAVTYFAPEPIGGLADAGYRGFWMGYFAGRAAPLGAVGPEVVAAHLLQLRPVAGGQGAAGRVDLSPARGRARGSSRRARRRAAARASTAPPTPTWPTAAELAGRAARSAPLDGRALFAANAALPWPDDPLGALWHAATLLREHRGDGHVARADALGSAGRECNVLQVGGRHTTRAVIDRARDYDDAEWQQLVDALAERGLLTRDGALTDGGER